jgi:hypothetical protein
LFKLLGNGIALLVNIIAQNIALLAIVGLVATAHQLGADNPIVATTAVNKVFIMASLSKLIDIPYMHLCCIAYVKG